MLSRMAMDSEDPRVFETCGESFHLYHEKKYKGGRQVMRYLDGKINISFHKKELLRYVRGSEQDQMMLNCGFLFHC
jgi:hypothetical protein